jgi:hypothetical protein
MQNSMITMSLNDFRNLLEVRGANDFILLEEMLKLNSIKYAIEMMAAKDEEEFCLELLRQDGWSNIFIIKNEIDTKLYNYMPKGYGYYLFIDIDQPEKLIGPMNQIKKMKAFL